MSWIATKLRNIVNHVTRPPAVAYAQHRHLKLHPQCEGCGAQSGGQAHHVKPYHKYPDLAADPSNFITLCETMGGLECHLHLGHGGNFKTYNPDILTDAAEFRQANNPKRRILLDAVRARRQVDA